MTAAPNPFAGRMLPARKDRVLVGVMVNRALDLKIELLAALDDKPKNELVLQALSQFLNAGRSCDTAHLSPSGSRQKRRITLTLSKDIDERLEQFAAEHHCAKTCAITAAMVTFLHSQKVNPYSDPTDAVRHALQEMPAAVVASDSW